MADITTIHAGKTPHRLHFIPQWAQKRRLRQADIARELPVDKATVSKWFAGSLPSEGNLITLAHLFHCEPNDLFRDPDDDWLRRFFEGRKADEMERIRATLEAAFPRRVG